MIEHTNDDMATLEEELKLITGRAACSASENVTNSKRTYSSIRMNEITNEALKAFLNSYIPFEVTQIYKGHLFKLDFMGDEYIMSLFGSWYPLRRLNEL